MSVFKCAKHNFGCDTPAEWRGHLAEKEHVTRGTMPCKQCGIPKEFVFTGKIVDDKYFLCEVCDNKLLEGEE